jgi:PKD repeat protein
VDPENLTVKFANSSRGDIADYYWYFGDHTSSNEENPVKQYDQPGLYRVALAVNNNSGDCADYVMVPVQVGEVTCEADFEVFVDSINNVAYFENKSIGNIEKFRWFFGDGYQSTRENPVHFYPAAGYYTTRLVTASGDCMSKAEETILIGAQGRDCEADFFASIDENSQTVRFVDESLGEDLTHIWNFGDGNISTEQNPVHSYDAGGYYNVCLTVINAQGVSNSTCKFIQVSTEEFNSCFAEYIYTVDSTTKTVTFTDLSAGDPDAWIWSFGDGSTSREQNPTHTYDEAGFYRVRLVSGNTASGCASLTIDLVNVAETADGIVAGFGYQVDSLSLKGSGKPVDFVGVSTGKSSNFSWDFGDGNSDSTTLTPTNVYTESGTYEVCFTVSDPITGSSNTYCDSVEVQLATDIDQLFDESYSLLVYPNPFSDEMRVKYNIVNPTDVDIEVYDELGRLVDVIVQEYKYEGEYEVVWRNHSIKNGIYNLRMRTENGVVKNLRIIKN